MSRSVRGPDYRRTEPEPVTAWDLLGSAPDFTGGLSVDEYMDEQRNEGHNDV